MKAMDKGNVKKRDCNNLHLLPAYAALDCSYPQHAHREDEPEEQQAQSAAAPLFLLLHNRFRLFLDMTADGLIARLQQAVLSYGAQAADGVRTFDGGDVLPPAAVGRREADAFRKLHARATVRLASAPCEAVRPQAENAQLLPYRLPHLFAHRATSRRACQQEQGEGVPIRLPAFHLFVHICICNCNRPRTARRQTSTPRRRQSAPSCVSRPSGRTRSP